jgi:hypothetical protein
MRKQPASLIPRILSKSARTLFGKYPVVTITGPRQSGKTTLAHAAFPRLPYVNLEEPDVRAFAAEDPRGFLSQYPRGAVLDEIQRVPDLPSHVQPIVDEANRSGMFVCTGSQHFELMRHASQSLAGRTAVLHLLPLSIEELGARISRVPLEELLLRGFHPRTHAFSLPPARAAADYFATYVERDLRQIVRVRELATFERFVRLCAGRCGQLLNMNSLANDAGVSHPTVAEWISLLETSYILFRLQRHHANVRKRLVKSPKLYFHDVGLAAWLLGIEDVRQVAHHPLRGALFENLVVSESMKFRLNRGLGPNLAFYRDSTGNEVDLLFPSQGKLVPVEAKSGMTISQGFLTGLNAFARFTGAHHPDSTVVYGGEQWQQRTDARFVPWRRLPAFLKSLVES